MKVSIAYRDLEQYYYESTLCGGPPGNPDYRLASVKENFYVLTWNNKNYAVPKERAETRRMLKCRKKTAAGKLL